MQRKNYYANNYTVNWIPERVQGHEAKDQSRQYPYYQANSGILQMAYALNIIGILM